MSGEGDSGPSTASRALIMVIVFAVIVLVGAAVVSGEVGQYQERMNNLEDRAVEVYGEDAEVVASDNCYETCASTATTSEIRRHSALIAADRKTGWFTAFELGKAVAGPDGDDVAKRLVEAGYLEKRQGNGILPVTEYRYVGPEGKYEDGLSDAALRELIRDRLYVSGAWTSVDEIVASVPAAEWRVREGLADLRERGVIKRGTESETMLGLGGHTAYAHRSVDHQPAGATDTMDLAIVALVIVVAVFLLSFARNGYEWLKSRVTA